MYSIKQRNQRDRRKLNKIRKELNAKSRRSDKGPVQVITHHRRLLKQKKLNWQRTKKLGIKIAQNPKLSSFWYSQERININYFKKTYQRVQSLKIFYGKPKDRQLQIRVKKANKKYLGYVKKNSYNNIFFQRTNNSLISFLESNLRTALWRRLLVSSIEISRQLIRHGHVRVNGTPVRKSSFVLKPGDFVRVRNPNHFSYKHEFIKSEHTLENLYFRNPPAHLEVSLRTCSFIFCSRPYITDLPFPFRFDLSKVINYYK